MSPRRTLALLIVSWALVCGCSRPAQEETETSEAAPVQVDVARRGPIRSVVRAAAVVAPAPGGEQLVVAPGPARIAEIPAGAGDPVRRGDLLVRFDAPALQAEVSAREADLRRARARLENATAALTRVEGLFARGIAAGKEVEDAKRENAEAEAALAEAESGRSAAGALAGRLTVRALFDGVVASRTHNPGDQVDPAANEVIVRLLDPDRLQVEAAVPAAALAGIHAGSAATVEAGAYPTLPARVRSVPIAVDPETSTATVRLDFVGPARLPAGAAVQVAIVAQEKADALIVPVGALVREGEESFVYTVDGDGVAHRTKVEVGLDSDTAVEILSGIDAGASVIVEGQTGLPDGARVAPAS